MAHGEGEHRASAAAAATGSPAVPAPANICTESFGEHAGVAPAVVADDHGRGRGIRRRARPSRTYAARARPRPARPGPGSCGCSPRRARPAVRRCRTRGACGEAVFELGADAAASPPSAACDDRPSSSARVSRVGVLGHPRARALEDGCFVRPPDGHGLGRRLLRVRRGRGCPPLTVPRSRGRAGTRSPGSASRRLHHLG